MSRVDKCVPEKKVEETYKLPSTKYRPARSSIIPEKRSAGWMGFGIAEPRLSRSEDTSQTKELVFPSTYGELNTI